MKRTFFSTSRLFKIRTYFFVPVVFLAFFTFLKFTFASPGVRQIKVGVAVTANAKTKPDWKETFLRRLNYASRIFESEFNIKFVPTVFWDWNSGDERHDMNYLMEDLKSNYPLEGVDIVIGLSRLDRVSSIEEFKDMEVLGRSQPFSGYVVIRAPENSMYKIQEETVLIHELGHLFGAIHTSEDNTIMAPYVDRQIPSRFDPVNKKIISLGRDLDFRNGSKSLDSGVIQQLLNSYVRLSQHSQSFEYYYSLGIFYLKLNQPEEALKAWQAASQIDSNSAQIHFDLGVLYSKMGKTNQAVSELADAVQRFTHSSERENKIEALMLLGGAYFRQGSLDAAYRAWSEAAVLTPDNFNVKLNLATIQLQRGQTEQAIQEYNRLISINPNVASIWSNLGAAYYQKKQYQKAIDCLKRALELSPNQTAGSGIGVLDTSQPAEIYKHIAHSYLALHQEQNALQYLELSCRINPTIDCRREIGETYFRLGRWDQAVQELAGVLSTEKNNSVVYGMLGVALFQKGDQERALSIFEEGVKHAESHEAAAQLYRNIGNLYFQAKKFDQATLAFQKAISEQWNNAESHFGLAVVYLSQNRLENARESLQTVLQIDPSNQKAREFLSKINSALGAQSSSSQSTAGGAIVH